MKKLEDYKWICPDVFTNVHVAITGVMKPCCAMNHEPEMDKYLEEYEICNIKDTSFWEYYNSDIATRLRNAMRNENDDEFVNSFCAKCKKIESVGNQSLRLFTFHRFNNEFKHKKEELERIIAEDIKPTFLHSMEVKPLETNKCNLACNMCCNESSSRYYAEAIRLKEVPKANTIIRTPVSDKFMNELPEIVDLTEEIKIVGGEPLMNEDTYELISLVENKSNKRLKIISNGTINPDRFISLATRFKEVDFNISVEGTPALTEYIRFPSKWKDVEETYNKVIKVAKIYFVSTVNCLNIGNMHEFEEFMESNGYLYANVNLVTNNFYSINSIPDDIKNLYLNRLYKAKNVKMIKYLEDSKYNEFDMWQMLAHVKRRDGFRKTNLLDVLPEWKTYYDQVKV